MERVKITEGVELVQPETIFDPERIAEVIKMVTGLRKEMFTKRERSKRRWLTDDFYKPLR